MRKSINENRDDDDKAESWYCSVSIDITTLTEDFQPRYMIEIDSEQAAFSCLVEGIRFSQFQSLFLFNNLCLLSKKKKTVL